jgi:hypothetical protein
MGIGEEGVGLVTVDWSIIPKGFDRAGSWKHPSARVFVKELTLWSKRRFVSHRKLVKRSSSAIKKEL